MFDGSFGFGGESAGASFLLALTARYGRRTRTAQSWICSLTITAVTGKDPGEHFRELAAEFGMPYYTRIDAAATPGTKNKLSKLSPEAVKESKLAGDAITAKLTRAPGNNAAIDGCLV